MATMRWTALCLLALFLLFPGGTAKAQVKVGTAGANFLQIGVSPRAAGMGEAFLPVADDAAAIYYNPGSLSLLEERQVFLAHVDWPADIRCEFAAVGLPSPQFGGVVGISFTILHMDDMEVTTPFYPNGTGQTFTARDVAFGLSYSRFLTDKFSFGATLKYIDLYVHSFEAKGWAADVGTYYDTGFESFRIAMSITNFGPDLKFITEKFPLPINFTLGFAIDPLNRGPHKVTTAFSGSHPSDNQERYNLGFEYWFKDMLSLRAGYKFNYDDEDISFGGGLKTVLGSLAAQIDYAYVPYEYIEQSHRFSLTLGF